MKRNINPKKTHYKNRRFKLLYSSLIQGQAMQNASFATNFWLSPLAYLPLISK